jgi:hypothetical protein
MTTQPQIQPIIQLSRPVCRQGRSKKPLAFLLCLFFIGFGYGQNLVGNPSFENYTICPNAGNENIESAIGWYNPTAYSPDYFNSCATDVIYGQSVPQNGFGFQPAKTGEAYAGLISMIETDGREYIQTMLIDTLVSGKSYTVKFYVSVADSSPYAANNIGAFFSNNPVSVTHSWVLPYSPQIENDPIANPLYDRFGWTEVSDTFIAQGGEKYITIGNFNNDLDTDTTYFSNGSNWLSFSYHYIDDVSVVATFPNSVDENYQTQISLYQNPANGFLYVNSPKLIERILIYSSTGQTLLEHYPSSKNFQVDLSQFSEGIYFVNAIIGNSIITNKIIINH